MCNTNILSTEPITNMVDPSVVYNDLSEIYKQIFTIIRDNVTDKIEIFNLLTEVSNITSKLCSHMKKIEYSDYILNINKETNITTDTREYLLNCISSKSSSTTMCSKEFKESLLNKYIADVDTSEFIFDDTVEITTIPIPFIDVNIDNISSAKFYYNFVFIIKCKTSTMYIELPAPVYMTLHSLQRILSSRFEQFSSELLFDSLYNASLMFMDFLELDDSPYELVIPMGRGLAYGNKDMSTESFCVYNYFNHDTVQSVSGYTKIQKHPMVITTCIDRPIMNYKQISLSNKLIKLFDNKPDMFNTEYSKLHSNFTNKFNAIRS